MTQTEASTAQRVTITSRRSDATVFSLATSARETVCTTTSICTRPRLKLKQALHCASQSLHAARANSHIWLGTMHAAVSTLGVDSKPTRPRCSGLPPASTQSQVGRNHFSRAMAARKTVCTTTSICTRPRTQDRLETGHAVMHRPTALIHSVAGRTQPYSAVPWQRARLCARQHQSAHDPD